MAAFSSAEETLVSLTTSTLQQEDFGCEAFCASSSSVESKLGDMQQLPSAKTSKDTAMTNACHESPSVLVLQRFALLPSVKEG